MSDEHNAYSVPPVERAFRVLRYIADGNPCANLSRAAKETGVNRTTLLRLLHTLEQEAMIEKAETGQGYILGTGLINLAASALYSRDIVQVAHPELRRLVRELGLSAHLGIMDRREITYLLRETPNLHLVSNVRVGSRLPAHATTIGRIILAHRDFAEVEALFAASEMTAATEKTATTLAALAEQLNTDRRIGIAWSVSNFEAGIGSAAAAVFDSQGKAVGAINVTGPDHEFAESAGRRDEIARALTAAAQRISHQLGHIPSSARIRHLSGGHHD
ncbi:MAG: IclR family transcriptional regulator [Phyllobacteriaceae bacterium]|nr:IclR family transcriptional regulator [Phyllobacteriaceae bacterium]MBA90942.1 IclR family transcriptional regulator [Phyllobacteriaceae bacterium]